MNPEDKVALLEKAVQREQKARAEAESLLEGKTAELIETNMELQKLHANLIAQQRQLVSTEKMAALGELAAGIMHEVNNPLAFVSSNIGTLQEYCDIFFLVGKKVRNLDDLCRLDALSDAQEMQLLRREDIDFIVKDAEDIFSEVRDGLERIRDIVNHLKDFTRTKTGDRTEIRINEVMDSALKIVHNKLKYNFDVNVCFGETPVIHGNKNELSQVLINLLVNAAQSVEQGRGTIAMESGFREGKIYISVSDNGKGISEENIDRIFNPFYTTKPVGEGTGLGLSVSAKIIENHGGEITVQSKVGVGSCFTVTIPVDQRQKAR